MFSRAFLLHDNQTTVHSRKEIAGWEEVNHTMRDGGKSPAEWSQSPFSPVVNGKHWPPSPAGHQSHHISNSMSSSPVWGESTVWWRSSGWETESSFLWIYNLLLGARKWPNARRPVTLGGPTEHSIYFCLHSEGHRLNRLSMTRLFVIISLHLSSCYDHSYLWPLF